jgi:hypothetical protein
MSTRQACKALSTLAIGILLAGCVSYYPVPGSDGVYAERAYPVRSVHYVDPLLYPYWSLDYFYFSRHYHPYSVYVPIHDPWYYPYPGWYFHDPRRYWAGYGPRYHHYRPWYFGGYFAFGRHYYAPYEDHDRVRDIDSRLYELETSRSLAVRAQRPDRPGRDASGAGGRGSASGRALEAGLVPVTASSLPGRGLDRRRYDERVLRSLRQREAQRFEPGYSRSPQPGSAPYRIDRGPIERRSETRPSTRPARAPRSAPVRSSRPVSRPSSRPSSPRTRSTPTGNGNRRDQQR